MSGAVFEKTPQNGRRHTVSTINQEILALAAPAIAANISIPLVSSFDTALMGRLSVAHLSALGIGGMIFMFIYGNFSFLRMGVTGLVAQARGRGDIAETLLVTYRAFALAVLISVLLWIMGDPIYALAGKFMHISPGCDNYAYRYFSIRLVAAPAVMGQFVMSGYFFGTQNAIYPLYVTLLVAISNVLFSAIMVLSLDMGIDGVAWGSVTAQYCGLFLAMWIFLRRNIGALSLDISQIVRIERLGVFFHVNKNIFVRTFALTFSLLFFYARSAEAGDEILAAMVVLMQFMVWMSFAIDGFANAAESLSGKYTGAGDVEGFRLVYIYSFVWGGVFASLFSFCYLFYGDAIVSLFTADDSVARIARQLMPYVALLPMLSFWAFIYDGIYIGITAVVSMRNAVLISMFFYISMNYLLGFVVSPAYAIWISFVSFFVSRGFLQWAMYHRYGMKLR